MTEDDTFFVMEEVGKILGVQLESVKLIEIYYDDSIPWRHYIYRAEILSGNPSKIKYEKIVWKSFESLRGERTGFSFLKNKPCTSTKSCSTRRDCF